MVVVAFLKCSGESRTALMKSMGLELPGMAGGGEGGGRKREALMREARYGVGSVLVEEGDEPTMVFVVVEGECRIVKGKPRSQSGSKKGIFGGYGAEISEFFAEVFFRIRFFFFLENSKIENSEHCDVFFSCVSSVSAVHRN